MRTKSKIWTLGVAGTALAVGVLLLFVVPVIRNPSASARTPHVATATPVRDTGPTVEPMRIVPVDASAVPAQWAPLTGDGSN